MTPKTPLKRPLPQEVMDQVLWFLGDGITPGEIQDEVVFAFPKADTSRDEGWRVCLKFQKEGWRKCHTKSFWCWIWREPNYGL